MSVDNGRTVMVTGCSTGIGRATALAFHEHGWHVVATARRPEDIADLAQTGMTTLALDVLDEESMRTAVAEALARYARIDVLVNNAGFALQGPVEETDLADARREFETNVFGLVRMCQLVLPGMRERRSGRIVNLSSMGGRFTFPGGGFYHASKHAVEALSDALRLEVAGFGVQVTLIEPGPVLTAFGTTALASLDEQAATDLGPYDDFRRRLAHIVTSAYAGRRRALASTPEDVADVIIKAAESPRARSRYLVGPVARALVTARRVLPDRAFDALLRSQWPTP